MFALGALAIFLARWLDDEMHRGVMLVALLAIIVVRVMAMIAGFLLAPAARKPRLLPFADGPARALRWFVIAVAVLYSLGLVVTALASHGALDALTIEVIRVLVWIVGLAIALTTIWRVRKPIADLIRGTAARGSVVAWIADLWPVAATLYFLALFAAEMSAVLAGTRTSTGIGFVSVLVIMGLPIVDMVLCRALAAAAGGGEAAAHPG